ncbi:MFS transporter, ACDE family, multidrug resistance protein [Evansella caseinilytica]|uniref:MFS transporter, ACDE family, multidrug resistance protein n=1 Tax=Evansella caseinilytica TaxID=1503961 RepID=A0A1H3NYF2_9BACI|nr:MFS transporter [Evansella caseinilytica]SDY93904.1 MFS transporter, ACDE family, multidrug resistance protein [Evansella caseinilytica]
MATQSKKGLVILAIGSIPLIMTLGNSMLIPILPKMQAELGITSFQVSLTITMFSATAAISIPIFGYLSDRFSRKAIIIPALFLYGIGGLLAGLAAAFITSPYIWIIIGRAMQGMGAAGTAPIAMALTGDLFKGSDQSKVLGIVEASNGFGKVLSPIVGSLLALLVWYAPFLGFPVFCIIAILLTIIFIREKQKTNKPPSFGSYLSGLFSVFKHEGRWLFTAYVAGAVCLFTLFGILFFLSDTLEKQYEIVGVWKGAILAVPLLFMMTTSYVTGSKIGKKLKRMKTVIIIGLLFMTVSFASLVLFTKLFLFIAVLAVSSIGTGLVLPCLNSLITGSVGKSRRGFVTSLYGSVRFLGVAAGPPAYGWLMGWSTNGMFYCTAGLTLFTCFLCLFFIHTKNQQSTGQNEKQSTLFTKIQLKTE